MAERETELRETLGLPDDQPLASRSRFLPQGTRNENRRDPAPLLGFLRVAWSRSVPSAPLLYNDPTLLFVNAGMVPFKRYFTGAETPPFDRATSVQKCVRTLDIDEVGKTTRHATFFQMNGNFSFGDYFKAEAIRYAWDLVTGSQDGGGYGFDPDKIWVTVLHSDDEAALLWESIAGLPAERIQRRGLLDNYWHMGVLDLAGPAVRFMSIAAPSTARMAAPSSMKIVS
jgi:alanyl-tRNA synthetase